MLSGITGSQTVCNRIVGHSFVAEFFVELWNLCGTRQNLSTVFHQQSQGLVEHANLTLAEGLRHYLHGMYEEWELHMPAVEFAYNHSIHPLLGISPKFRVSVWLQPPYASHVGNPRHSVGLRGFSLYAMTDLVDQRSARLHPADSSQAS